MVGTLDFSVIDEVMQISDRDSFLTARRLAREEGIFVGGSTGTAVFGALKVAKELGPGKILIVMLADSGDRYLSKCFDDDWMKDMGFLGPEQRLGTVREVINFKGDNVEFALPDETLGHVASRMAEMGISQMPVKSNGDGRLMMIHELDLLQSLVSGKCTADDTVDEAATELEGEVTMDDSLSKVQSIFDADNVAVVVEKGKVIGVITKIDVVEFLASRR